MDNGTTGHFAHGPRSIAIVGDAAGYLFACRAALLGGRLLPVIGAFDRRRMRLARALGSLPHLRRHFVPTARSRVVGERLQWNLSPGIEQPSQDVRAALGQPTPLASSLMLWVTRVLIAGLVVVALIPNLVLGGVFCAGYLLARLRGRWRGDAHRPSNRLSASPPATAHSNCESGTQTEAIARQFQHSH